MHCGIRFVTDPRNAWRRNLGCPFGCRQHHRKQCSNQRSRDYRHTPEGREKKRLLNAQRSLRVNPFVGDQPASDDELEPDDELAREDSVESPTAEPCSSESQQESSSGDQQSCCPHEDKPQPSPDIPPEDMQLVLDEVVLTPDIVKSSPMLPYLTKLIRLIEGRPLRQNDLVAHLLEALRQHSMAYRTRTDYVLCFLHQHPP